LNHELAISRPFLREAKLSPRVQKIYRSYIQGLERAEGKASRPLGFRFLARLAHYLTWIILPLQVAFFAAMIAVYLSRKGRALRPGGLAASAVLGATYGIVLAIAIGHSLDVSRFRVSYAPGFLLGLAIITNYLLIFTLGTRIPDKQLSKTT
jgi:lipopolysaccharide export LptBFGC system permease protein LptF